MFPWSLVRLIVFIFLALFQVLRTVEEFETCQNCLKVSNLNIELKETVARQESEIKDLEDLDKNDSTSNIVVDLQAQMKNLCTGV